MFYAAKHLLEDLLTAVVFVAVYAASGDLPLAISATIAVAVCQIGIIFARGKKPDAMVWLSIFLAAAFALAALVSRDPRFVMVKPSIIHGVIAIAMLRRGWMNRYMSERSKTYIPGSTIIAVGYGWAAFMFALAAANLAVALTMPFAVWAWFVSAGLLGAKALGFVAAFVVFRTAAARQVRQRTVMP